MQDMEVLGEYTYDANGQRLSKTVNNQTDTYYYDGINLLYVTGDHWGDEIFLQNPGGDVIMSLRGAERYPYRTDIRGNLRIHCLLKLHELFIQTNFISI